MGAKTSKSELTRRKSFSNLGRSSQRSLFQKCKLKLNRTCKEIEAAESESNAETIDRISNDLDGIEKELNGITDAVKAKNQEKYDEVCRYLQSTRKKFTEKFKSQKEPNEDTSEIILRNPSANNNVVTSAEVSRKPSVTFKESKEESADCSEEHKKPGIRFGVQVLPSSAQISQVVLKRKTYPTNSSPSPKNEFTNRNTTEGSFPHAQNGTSTKITIQTSNSFTSKTESVRSNTTKNYTKSNSISGIEAINNEINELEGKLRYFTGSKDSPNYILLHQGFVNNLAILERIDSDEDPITKQEKRILRQRICELINILECLVEPVNSDSDDQFYSANTCDHLEDRPRLLTSVTAI